MAFIQITDTHFMAPGRRLYGLDPAQRLADMVTIINRDHADAEFVLITGDLADEADPAAYDLFRQTIAELTPPVHLMLGNHDSRAPFAAAFPGAAMTPDGFVQFRLHANGADVLCLDTLVDLPAEHAGHLCQSRLSWLAAALASLNGAPYLLALHHPPFDVGLPYLDDIRLDQASSDALAKLIEPHPPAMILCGHVHRPIHGVWRGAPYHIQRAVNHQVAYQTGRAEPFRFTDEAAEFAVISTAGPDVTILTRSMAKFDEFDARGPRRTM